MLLYHCRDKELAALQKELAKRDKAVKAAEKALAAKEGRAAKTEERLKEREASSKALEVVILSNVPFLSSVQLSNISVLPMLHGVPPSVCWKVSLQMLSQAEPEQAAGIAHMLGSFCQGSERRAGCVVAGGLPTLSMASK